MVATFKVAKFGGTSLADAGQITKVIDIVLADPARRIVVVSAPGKRQSGDTKVTDMLIALANQALGGADTEVSLKAIVERFAEIQRALKLPVEVVAAVEKDLRHRLASSKAEPGHFMDLLKAAGEDNSARVTAEAFKTRGVAASYVNPGQAGLLMTEEAGNATVLPESYAALKSLRNRPDITVFPGFFGQTRSGRVVTFPRGGSDITGAILAAAVGADIYENFSDVDSVFAVDPRVVPGAKSISLLTYREMRELAYAGFSVFHDEAIEPVVHAGIPIHIRNTNRPEAAGTLITPRSENKDGTVVGVAGSDGFCTVFVDKYLMNREIGFGRRFLQIFEEEQLSYEHTPSGIDCMSAILQEKQLTPEKEQRVLDRVKRDLRADAVDVERGLALIMVVGEGMRNSVGTAARATAALAKAKVSIEMINQGSSEISIMFGVKSADRTRAVEALYKAFFE
jgi:aspartate kinase